MVEKSLPITNPKHLAWVRRQACLIAELHQCSGPIEAAHRRIGTDCGVSTKPSDCFAVPLCHGGHMEQHQIGELSFEKKYDVCFESAAGFLTRISPYWNKGNYRHTITSVKCTGEEDG